ncbi:MAG: sortase-associated OmpA-like protein PdsO [Gammaproteobacteria bacterium]|nr:sortase-associated OmpA-like protein PdsO [Gammaproteobacteria bacterium]MBL4728852.1 sortase-associated OmpA-like protein PdsO [Gammaproteobacteria bacterium]
MIKQISLALIFTLASATAAADSRRADYQNPPSKEETTGALSGAILGGFAGGPPGVIVGAAFGALFGEGWRAKSNLRELQANFYENQLHLAALREEAQTMQAKYQLAEQRLTELSLNRARTYPANMQLPTTPCCDNTVLSLNFRSGSSAIEKHYEEQLTSLIKIAEQMPSARVEITGYADRNGNSELNLKLSRERSNSVKQFLNSRGIQSSFIRTIAHGETKPLHPAQNFESDFFDRRVIVRLRDNSSSMLTQSPDGE